MASPLRKELRELLERKDFDGVVALSTERRNLYRHLVALTYDKEDVISWRAMEAIGAVTARMSPDEGRNVIQKVLWMLREESGNNAWSAPEILGEILRANPKPYLDIVPVLVSFHDEEFFRAGVLWAMYRIALRWPELMEPFSEVAVQYIESRNPAVKTYSALLLGVLGKAIPENAARDEDGAALYYEDGELTVKTLSLLLREAAAAPRP